MARQESDREDLLAEARALVERAELSLGGYSQPVVIGFRRNGAVSIFLGADPVYQFNVQDRLRRAFVDGLLYKAAGGELVSLRRVRTSAEVQLVRHDLDIGETADFMAAMQRHLGRLADALAAGDFQIVGRVPLEADVVERFRHRLPVLLRATVANSPRVA